MEDRGSSRVARRRVSRTPFAVAIVVVGAVAALLWALWATRESTLASLSRATDLRTARQTAQRVLQLQLDEETGIRGYVTSRRGAFLTPYRNAEGELPEAITELALRVRILGLADDEAWTEQLRALNEQWVGSYARPILRLGPRAASLARLTGGKALVDRMRLVTSRIDTDLTTRIAQADADVAHSLALAGIVAVAAVTLSAGLVAYAAIRESRLAARARDLTRVSDFRALADALDHMVWTAQPDGTRDYYSARWTEYTGRSDAELRADAGAVIHPDDRREADEAWRTAIATGTNYRHDLRVRSAQGTFRWHRGRALPTRDERGRILAWLGSTTDIDDDRRSIDSLRHAYESEKRLTERLQTAFALQRLPDVAGMRFDAIYAAATQETQVGGDWFDVLVLPDGRVLFSVGDVSGHGVDAAVVMIRARQAIVASALGERDPSIVLARANRVLLLQSAPPMVTALCGFILPGAMSGSFASAGHPVPVVVSRAGSVRDLPPGGIPLGVSDAATYASHRLDDLAGALLVAHTDGAVEYGRDVIAGEARLREIAADVARRETEQPAHAIFEGVFAGGAPADDVAILTIAFEKNDGAGRTVMRG